MMLPWEQCGRVIVAGLCIWWSCFYILCMFMQLYAYLLHFELISRKHFNFFFTNWLQYCMLLFNFFIFNNQIVINLKKKNPCVEMDNILGMEVGNSYNGLYIHHFNLQEKCLVLVVLDLNVYCWLTEAVSAHFIDMDVPFCKGVQLWNRYI